MRILGIDYGEKRVGLAVSDELGLTARGLAVVERKSRRELVDAIAKAVKDHAVIEIVVGYPLRLDGSRGIQCEKVDRFMEDLRNALEIPVVAWDETLTTCEAQELMRETGVKRKKQKGVVDRIAAALMLQDYLNKKARPGAAPEGRP